MYENFLKYGMLITPVNLVLGVKTFVLLAGILLLMIFCIFATFLLETHAPKINYYLFHFLHMVNFSFLLGFPIVFHKWDLIHPISGMFVFMGICIIFLKLWSYSHFWNDVRKFVLKKKRLIKNDEKSLKLQEHIYKEVILILIIINK